MPAKPYTMPEWVAPSEKDKIAEYDAAKDPHCKIARSKAAQSHRRQMVALAAADNEDHRMLGGPTANAPKDPRAPRDEDHLGREVARHAAQPDSPSVSAARQREAVSGQESLSAYARARGSQPWVLGNDPHAPEVSQDIVNLLDNWETFELDVMKMWSFVGVQCKTLVAAEEEQARVNREARVRQLLAEKQKQRADELQRIAEERQRLAALAKQRMSGGSKDAATPERKAVPRPPPKSAAPNNRSSQGARPLKAANSRVPSATTNQKQVSSAKSTENPSRAAAPPREPLPKAAPANSGASTNEKEAKEVTPTSATIQSSVDHAPAIAKAQVSSSEAEYDPHAKKNAATSGKSVSAAPVEEKVSTPRSTETRDRPCPPNLPVANLPVSASSPPTSGKRSVVSEAPSAQPAAATPRGSAVAATATNSTKASPKPSPRLENNKEVPSVQPQSATATPRGSVVAATATNSTKASPKASPRSIVAENNKEVPSAQPQSATATPRGSVAPTTTNAPPNHTSSVKTNDEADQRTKQPSTASPAAIAATAVSNDTATHDADYEDDAYSENESPVKKDNADVTKSVAAAPTAVEADVKQDDGYDDTFSDASTMDSPPKKSVAPQRTATSDHAESSPISDGYGDDEFDDESPNRSKPPAVAAPPAAAASSPHQDYEDEFDDA